MFKFLFVLAISGFYVRSSNAGCCNLANMIFERRETVIVNGEVVRDECNVCRSGLGGTLIFFKKK